MTRVPSKSGLTLRIKPLASSLALALGMVATIGEAGAVAVTNCNDSGIGSLREAVDTAVSGDTIDLSSLACAEITLTTGALSTAIDNLTVIGRESGVFINEDDNVGRMFLHLGAGLLDLRNLTFTAGSQYLPVGSALGGCLYSSGSIRLENSRVRHCRALSPTGNAYGGGLFADGSVTLINSAVYKNHSDGSGGGIYASNGLVAIHSIVRDNTAGAIGGGVFVRGASTVEYSAILGNDAGDWGGGARFSSGPVTIRNSTISGNTADAIAALDIVGGGRGSPTASIINSTVAYNESRNSGELGGAVYVTLPLVVSSSTISRNAERHDLAATYGGGLTVGSAAIPVELNNSIVSDNYRFTGAGTVPVKSDIGVLGASPATLAGVGNLVGHLVNASLAPGNRIGPANLGPLQDNGGPTPTMVPGRRGPAINGGGSTNLAVDQRGIGFARSIGAAVDIGAVETDTLFADYFEVFHEISP